MIVTTATSGKSQMADTTLPFYKRFPTITPFQILLSDSATMYSKASLPANKAVAFIVFSPDCEHCQHEARELHEYKDQLKDYQIVMITLHPFDAMKEFISTYQLNELPNVVVGKDIYYLMPTFYKFHSLPFHAMYDKEGNLIAVFEGAMGVRSLVETMK